MCCELLHCPVHQYNSTPAEWYSTTVVQHHSPHLGMRLSRVSISSRSFPVTVAIESRALRPTQHPRYTARSHASRAGYEFESLTPGPLSLHVTEPQPCTHHNTPGALPHSEVGSQAQETEAGAGAGGGAVLFAPMCTVQYGKNVRRHGVPGVRVDGPRATHNHNTPRTPPRCDVGRHKPSTRNRGRANSIRPGCQPPRLINPGTHDVSMLSPGQMALRAQCAKR